MDILSKPYTATTNKDLFTGQVELVVMFPKFGKSVKNTRIVCVLPDDKEIEKMTNHFVKRECMELVSKFLNSKQLIFELYLKNQNRGYLNALSELRNQNTGWAQRPFYSHLERQILPQMEVLKSASEQSKSYKYDRDVIEFLTGVVQMHNNLVSL